MRSLAKYLAKSKQVRGDPIQERLLEADGVIIDDHNELIVVNPSQSVDFIPVHAL